MLKQTPKSRVLFVRKFSLALLVLFGVFSFVFINLRTPNLAYATTSSTVNFQARLQTAAGGIVPDGNYNVEFKLYSVSSGGTALWTEDYLNSAGHGLQTVNGYLSTSLGSLTSFPSTIDWSQKLWLTMNIGGTTTGSVTWDGEMNPRITLTAVPYAFQAGRASTADQLSTTSGSNVSTLSIQAPTGGNQTFTIQDQGAAGTYNLLAQNSSSGVTMLGTPSSLTGKLSFATAGSGNSVTLQSAGETVGNATISLPDTAGVDDTICLQTLANCGSTLTVGNLDGGTANAKGATLTSNTLYLQSASASFAGLVNTTTQTFAGDKTFTGNTVFNTASNSLTGFQVMNSGGTILDVDTQNGRVGINKTNPGYALDVNGDINSNTAVRVGGVAVCTVSSCTPASGSNNYIQNGTSVQTSANISIRSSATNAVTEVIQGANGQTSDILQVQSWNGTSTTNLMSVTSAGTFVVGSSNQFTVDASGNFTAKGTGTIQTTSATALQVQNSSNVNMLVVDTSANTVNIGATASSTAASTVNIGTTNSSTGTQSVNIGSNAKTANSVNIEAGNSGKIQIGNADTAHTIQIGAGGSTNNQAVTVGSANGSSALTLQAGSGNIALTGVAGTAYTIGSTATTGTITLGQSTVSSGISIGSNNITTGNTQTISIGTGSDAGTGKHAITIGNTSSASSLLLQAGTGDVAITGAVATNYTIGATGTTGTITVGQSTASNIINIGNANTATGNTQTVNIAAGTPAGTGSAAVTIGNTKNASAITLQSGTGSINLNTDGGASSVTGTIVKSANNNSNWAFQVQNASANTLFNVDTANNTLTLGINGANNNTVNIATANSNQSTVTIGNFGTSSSVSLKSGTNGTTLLTNGGTGSTVGTIVRSQTNNSTLAFQVQNASSVSLFTVDTTNTTITLGSSASGNYVTFTAAGGLTSFGTAQHTKSISLYPEYAGAVFDSADDTACSSANSGTLTSGWDSTNRANYYNWTATSGTSQCYDVVVQVNIPSDWSSWAASDPINIQTTADNTSNGSVSFKIMNSSGTADTNYNYGSPSTSTSWTDSASSSLAGTYTANSTMYIKVRLSAKSSANVKLGAITLNYNSKY